MFKKIFKSRVVWFVIGGFTLPWLVRLIPVEFVKTAGAFIWSQKWGVLIGIGVMVLLNTIRSGYRGRKYKNGKKGFFGFKIVRDDDLEGEELTETPFD